MEPETSKAQLRSRVRAARADRSLTAAAAVSSSSVTTVSPQITPTEATPSSSSPAGSVAASAWNIMQEAPIRSLLAYAALPGEPNLDSTLDQFLAAGGTVYLPVVTTVGEPLMFGQVTGSMTSLQPHGRWGIREPAQDDTLLTAAQLLSPAVGLDLIFVPALGFGIDGARLGNGGGFYDRTFGPYGAEPLGTDSRVVGVCFAEEIGLTGLVAEDWDLRIPAAVTEDGTHTFTA